MTNEIEIFLGPPLVARSSIGAPFRNLVARLADPSAGQTIAPANGMVFDAEPMVFDAEPMVFDAA